MKRSTIFAGAILLLVFALLIASTVPSVTQSGPYQYVTFGVRKAFSVLGKAVIGDSLRVQGNFLVNGNTTLVGTLTTSGGITLSDSLAVQTIVIGKGQNSYLYTLRSVMHGGSVTLSLDTLGNLIAYGKVVADDSLRSQGPLLSNGAVTVANKAIINDSLRSQGPFTTNGIATFNSRIVSGTAAIAKIDSFSTTDSSKHTYMPGASLGDVFVVSEYLPSYSAVADTGNKLAAYFVATDTVGVERTKLSAVSSRKSGGLFSLIKVDK